MRKLLLTIALASAVTPVSAQTTEILLCEHVCTMPLTCTTNANQYSVSVINMNGWVNFSCTGTDGARRQWTRRFTDWLPEDGVVARPPTGNSALTCQTFCVQSNGLIKQRR